MASKLLLISAIYLSIIDLAFAIPESRQTDFIENTSKKIAFNIALSLEEISEQEEKAEKFLEEGIRYYESQDYIQAINYSKHALQIFQHIGNQPGEIYSLQNLGFTYEQLEEYKKAIKYHEKVLEIYRETKDLFWEARLLCNLGDIHYQIEEYQKARGYYEQALRISRQAKDKTQERRALINLGNIAYVQKDYENSIFLYEQNLALVKESGDPYIGGDVLSSLGFVHHHLENYEDSLKFHQESLERYRRGRNRSGEKNALINIGVAFYNLGEYNKSIELFNKYLEISRQLHSRIDESKALLNLGMSHENLKNHQKAIEFYKQALEITRELGGVSREKTLLMSLGNILLDTKQYKKSIPYFRKSLAIGIQYQDVSLQLGALRQLGLAFHQLQDYSSSIKCNKQALTLLDKTQNKLIESEIMALLGSNFYAINKYIESSRHFEVALKLSREINDKELENYTSKMLGYLYLQQGYYSQAIKKFKHALVLSEQAGEYHVRAEVFKALGYIYEVIGSYEMAINYHENALDFYHDADLNFSEVIQFKTLIALYKKLGNQDKSNFYTQKYLDANRGKIRTESEWTSIKHSFNKLYVATSSLVSKKDNVIKAVVLSELGDYYRLEESYDKALDSYRQALFMAREFNFRELEGSLFAKVGNLFQHTQQPELAITAFKQSVNVREGIRDSIQDLSLDLKKSYTRTVAEDYRTLADLLIDQGRISEAQNVLELLKIQELNEFSRGTRSPDQVAQLKLNGAEEKIREKHGSLIAFGKQFFDCEVQQCKELSTLQNKYRELDKAFYALATEISQSALERRKQKIAGDTDDFQASADTVVAAHPDSVLIYPLILENKVRLLWASKGGVLADEICAVSETDLNQMVANFQELLRTPNSDISKVKHVGKKLYDCLVKPIEPELETNKIKHLIFSPDRVTNYIPMAALHDGEQFLIEKYRVSNVLSAGLTKTDETLPKSSDQISVLGLGLSEAKAGFNPLEHVPQEIDALVKRNNNDPEGIYPGDSFLNNDFTLSALENNVRGRNILHIATHGEFVPAKPRDSYLLLGTGEKYPIPEIQTLRGLRDIHLVVLSACETAIGGQDHTGIEVSGISSYFLKDRAKAVLASLWKVNDASTSNLMQQFYHHLGTENLSKAEAIRQAQLDLIRARTLYPVEERASVAVKASDQSSVSQDLSHPYYWAPFILIGNGL